MCSIFAPYIKELHGDLGGFTGSNGSGLKQRVWNGITSAINAIDNINIPFKNSFSNKVGSGENTRFWLDLWARSGRCFKDLFPQLFTPENSSSKGSMGFS